MREKTIVYDIVPEMKIRLSDGRVVTLGELEHLVMLQEKLFAYAPWSTNPNPRSTRILAGMSADGLALFDLKTRISHRWKSRKQTPVDFEEIGKLLRELTHG